MATPLAPNLLLSVDLTGFLIALETRIQSALPMGWGDVQCRVVKGRLGVGWWRAIADPLPERDCLTVLIQAIQTALWETELPEALPLEKGTLPIQIYWQYRGQPHPTAAWIWHWQPGNALSALFDDLERDPGLGDSRFEEAGPLRAGHLFGHLLEGLGETETAVGADSVLLPVSPPAPPTDDGSLVDGIAPPDSLEGFPRLAPEGSPPHPAWAEPSQAEPSRVPPVSPADPKDSRPWHRSWWPWSLLITLGLGVGGLGYGLSRPCVIGACPRQATAQTLSQGAIAQLQPQATGSEVLTAYRDLQQAVGLLTAVPPWSPHYAAVQADLQRYQPYLSDLEWIVTAQTLGLGAVEASQFPPYAVSHWRQVYGDWQRAIAALDHIPETSPLTPLRNTKRLEYLDNYQAVGDRIAAERTAEMNLNQALQLAQAATAQAGQAYDLLTWDAVHQDWQGAVDALARIPRGTLAHRDARTLVTPYRENLAAARTQVIQQQAGEFAHRRAVAAEIAARQAETQNQWTQAVSQWRQAIAALEQIPNNTAHSPTMTERLTAYQNALAIAQDNLRRAVLLQDALAVMTPLCPDQGDRCRTVILNQRLVVQLQPPYDRALAQSLTPSVTGTPTPMAIPTRTFLQELTNRLDLLPSPTSIQDAAGQPLGEYHPDHGGYRR